MNLRELKNKFLNAKVSTDDIQVKFRSHRGYTYYNCNCYIERYNNNSILIIELIDKTIPNFKIGDKVTSIDGLFPEVGYTIAEVNEEEQYYTYKEVHGRTYFKDQDKLILVKPDSSTPPVEEESKFAESILGSIKSTKFINIINSISFNVPKRINTFKVIEKLTADKTLKIIAELNSVTGDTITIKW